MKLVGSKGAVRSIGFHKKKEREKKFYQFFFVIILLIILVGPIFLLRSNKLLISEVSVMGNAVTQSSEIESIVRESLGGFYLGVIPRASTLFYPEEEIASVLDARIPRLASVNISLNGLKGVSVEVKEREPFGLYCTEIGETRSCYFLDNTGHIYSEAPDFTDGVYLVYERDPSLESPIDKYFLNTEEFSKVNKFINSLDKLDMKAGRLLYRDGEYSLKLSNGTEVIWSEEQDNSKLLIDLESFLKGTKLNQGEVNGLLYLDLRFDNKVYYKGRE